MPVRDKGDAAVMGAYDPKEIASRIQKLIESEDNGDLAAASRRLGLSRELLAELVECAPCDRYLGEIAAVIRGYEVDAIWLLTGGDGVTTSRLAPELRLQCAELLSQIGREIIIRRRRNTDSGEGRAIA